uniref:Helically-extended SH3 domain-containing protein n=1 Tax=Myripristis murdjan TaxID=586833 RepID=A0A667XFW1_9TELE
DSKEEKENRKFEGPLRVLHTMMVDPNGVIKKPGGKDLAVTQGEILDVIQLTSSKKALCRNQYGKCRFQSHELTGRRWWEVPGSAT